MADPPIIRRLVRQLRSKGYDNDAAHAIAVSTQQRAGNLKPGTSEPTAKGKARGAMTPAARAKDREARESGRKPGEFKYDPKTNRARLKR